MQDNARALLTKEDTIKTLEQMEEQKIQVMKTIQKTARDEGWTNVTGQTAMQVEKNKAFDRLFLEQGITEEDIQRAVTEHNLINDPDFKAMNERINAKQKAEMIN